MKKFTALFCALVMLMSLPIAAFADQATVADVPVEELEQWAAENGYVKQPDAYTSATLAGTTSLAFGTIHLEQDEMKALLREMAAGPFSWNATLNTGNGNVQDLSDVEGEPKYRDMYVLGTTYNNVPNAATAEFVLDAQTYGFYGQSESETSKMYDMRNYPDVTLTWVCQMDRAKAASIGDYGFLHGFVVYGKGHIFTLDDLNPSGAAEGYDHSKYEEACVRYMDVYMPSYYPTRWDFPFIDPTEEWDYSTDPDYAAKVDVCRNLIGENAMTLCYVIEPERITVNFFSTYAPSAIKETAAWSTYINYADASVVYGENGTGTEADGIYEINYTGYDLNRYVEARADDGTGPKCAIYYWVDDGSNPEWENPYNESFTYFRSGILDVFQQVKSRWLAEEGTEQVIADKSGLEDELTFTRFVSNTEVTVNATTGAESNKVLTEDDIAGLVQGVDYHVETITLPNYSKLLLVSEKTACGFWSQNNILFSEDLATALVAAEEAAEIEGETDGEFVYNALEDGTYEVTAYVGSSGIVKVPAEYNGQPVTKIGADFLRDNEQVSDLTLPDTITEIGDNAFNRLRKVRMLEIPQSVTTIGENAFLEMGYGTQGSASSQVYVVFSQYSPDGIEQNHMLGENADVSSIQVRFKVPSGATAAYAEAWPEYAAFITETMA